MTALDQNIHPNCKIFAILSFDSHYSRVSLVAKNANFRGITSC